MKLLEADLFNFRSFVGHHCLTLKRPAGVYLVRGTNQLEPSLGANGSGKSTLLIDAVLWCFYGRTMGASRSRTEPRGTGKAKVVVKVKLELAGTVCQVTRGRNPNLLMVDEQEITQEALEERLGVSMEVFTKTILIGQTGKLSDLFLDMSPERQSQLFTSVLDLDVWIRAAALAGKCGKASTKLAEGVKLDLARLEGKIQQMQETLEHTKTAAAEFTTKEKHRQQKLWSERKPLMKRLKALAVRKVNEVSVVKAHKLLLHAETSLAVAIRAMATADHTVATYRTTKTCPVCGSKVTVQHIKDKIVEAKEDKETAEQEHGWAKENCEVAKVSLEVAQLKDRLLRIDEEQLARDNPHKEAATNLENALVDLERAFQQQTIELDKYNRAIANYSLWVTGFKEIRLQLIDAVLEELEVSCNYHLQALGCEGWRLVFATERENQSGTVSVKFTVSIYPSEEDLAYAWGDYSGGESQRLRLAVTFGLAEVLLAHAGIDCNIEVLDEPTQHLSLEGIEALCGHLSDRAKVTGRAIYLIDHRALDAGIFAGVVEVVKDADGSRIVGAE